MKKYDKPLKIIDKKDKKDYLIVSSTNWTWTKNITPHDEGGLDKEEDSMM